MTSPREWVKPPKPLLIALCLFTGVSISALAWFGWQVLEQEKLVEAQRSRESLEQTADRLTAVIREQLADAGDRLGGQTPEAEPPSDGILLLIRDNALSTRPANRLLFHPDESTEPEADPAKFADAEQVEFVQKQPLEALRFYEGLFSSADAAVRAGALVRAARVLRNLGRTADAIAKYRELAGVRALVAATPAGLLALHALAELSGDAKNIDELRSALTVGGWHLRKGQFEFFWEEANRVEKRNVEPAASALALSNVASQVFEQRRTHTDARGDQTLWLGDTPYFLIWRGTPERRTVLVTHPSAFVRSDAFGSDVAWSLVDSQGRRLAGDSDGFGRAVVRTAASSQLPWTLRVAAASPLRPAALAPRQRLLLVGLAAMVVILIGGTYLIARAIRREAQIQRMQSDFVSAVSHEFRSPLTSMRQLSEILAFGRVPSEERRQVYYETLVSETTRLQRLVESLLNFGRMEAGARKYRFEELDAGALVRHVAAEFEPQIADRGCRIAAQGPDASCWIEADPDALSVAVRNVIDNALKYSGGHATVWVEWGIHDGAVAIDVKDKGPGIAESEREAIFHKFVRGAAASSANVKGSGVGLAMVRHIIDAHGGEIKVESALGAGTTFTILLPALPGKGEDS